tara:strand:- start:744 stop:1013 length:270 start_codon:yes stop_codon:yes gene_type:complete
MIIEQDEKGNGKFKFTDDEIKILNEKKELFFPAEVIRHFQNVLMKLVAGIQERLPGGTMKYMTTRPNFKYHKETIKVPPKDKDDKLGKK